MNKYIQKIAIHLKWYLDKISFFNSWDDERYLIFNYKLKMGRKLDLKNPKTFNEKLQWLKLHDRNPEYTKMVDKYEVKKYISDKLGEDYIIPTLGVWDSFDEINFNLLPKQFVLKCTHDSGGVVVIKDKDKIDIKKVKKKLEQSMKKNYYYIGREWPYKNIKPRIIAEKYMVDESGYELKDYKLMVFGGKVKYSFVCTNRNSKKGLCINFYDKEWNPMPFERHYPKNNKEIKKPENYELMVEFAELLGKDIPFIRVDFYEVTGKIYFGELTFYPGSGVEEFSPEEWDYKLGELIKLPKIN
ncbi:MAG: glycosyl transferase [Clostridia bacterium]|nr:glycosyl transferase [Clostridia bacterium]